MAIETIYIGNEIENTDTLRDGFDKVNANTSDLDVNKVPYSGARGNVDLGENQLKAGQLELDKTPSNSGGVGVFRWNDTDGTADLGLKGGNVTLQIGQEQVLRVVNKAAVNLLEANYQAVKIIGATGQRLSVDLAQADNDLNSATTIGIVTETIAKNQEGFVTTSGAIREINTTGSLQSETWVDGDVLYLSPTTAGKITNIKPTAPNHLIIVGYVEYAHAIHGKIFVKVDNGYELDELHNVSITTPINDQSLKYDSSTDLWKNKLTTPQLTTSQRLALTPSAGFTVYDTDLYCLCFYNGYNWTFVDGFDSATSSFLSVTGINDSIIKTSLNALVLDLKKYGIWTKMKAVYPFVGGTATTHKFNLINPTDSDAAFRLSFLGGWTHDSNGATPNGTNGYADTFLTPSATLSLNNTSLSLYSRTNKSEASIDIGCQGGGNATYAHWNYLTTTAFRGINSSPTTRTAISNTSGLLTASRIVSNNEAYYTNGSIATNYGATSTALTTQKIIIGARNNGGSADLFANKQYSFSCIGEGLNATEASNLYTAVQKFQTNLSRQV